MLRKCLIILALLTAANFLFAQSKNQLKERIKILLAQQHLSGAVWTTVCDSGNISTDASGYKNSQTKDYLSSKDKVLVGSVSKTVMAAGFLRMATTGALNLDDPVKKYLPDLPLKNKWEKLTTVTIRHLLDHTSGLTDAKLWQVFSTTAKPSTPLDYVYAISPEVLTVQTRPGTVYSYSNIGYNILGLIIEAIGKEPYEDYLSKELLRPLGMNSSSFHFLSQREDRQLAFGHFDDGKPVNAMPMYLRAAGQFVTTADDMGRFLRFLMSDGVINNTQFINKEYLKSIGKQTTTDAYQRGVPFGDALGGYSRDRYGVVGIAKNGNTLGFVSMIYMFPDYRKAFFIAFNMDSETSDYDIFNEVLVKHLGLPVKPFISSGHVTENDIKNWGGYYIPVVTKVEPFGLLDIVFSHTKADILETGASLSPFQGKQKNLLYQGNHLFSMKDRTTISHSFYDNGNGHLFITDGIKTIKKISGVRIVAITTSLFLGLSALIYLLGSGIFTFINTKFTFIRSPQFWIFTAIVTLSIAIAFVTTQPFIKMGNYTFGNIFLAMASILLPVFSFLSIILFVIKQDRFYYSISFWASVFVLQLCILLIANNLMPIFMWK